MPYYPHSVTFTKERFNLHDPPTKVAVQSLLKQIGYTITNEDEAYGSHDFIVEKDGLPKKVEVEHKTFWRNQSLPDKMIREGHDISHRKLSSKSDMFFQVNLPFTAMAYCPMSVVHKYPVIKKDTCWGTKDEPFFRVPVSEMKYYYLQDGEWYEEDLD